jgi:tRNA nucleotidyltransferase (CCA-adding enzyme)
MLGKCVRASIVNSIGSTDEAGYTYPLNFAKIYNTSDDYAYILGIDHPVKNFDGRVIAMLQPKFSGYSPIWIMAPKSSRFINLDIVRHLDVEKDYPDYRLVCLYESSSGAIVYREISGEIRYLLIKNKRSAHWGFPKGHLEEGETPLDAAKREVLEETGLHIDVIDGFEGVSEYKIRNLINKQVSIFIGTTQDTRTSIQESEIDDYIWLTYENACAQLKYENDRSLLTKAVDFLAQGGYIGLPEGFDGSGEE